MAAESAAAASSGINAGAMAGISTAGSLLGSVVNYALNRREADRQRKWNEQMMDKQNDWSLNMWNKTNEYNTPAAQVQRLQDAGLNPLYYGLDGSSANAFESAQPMGYDRAQAPQFGNPASEGLAAFTQMKSLEKDIELKNAQIDKMKADTTGVELDNQFKDLTMEARAQSEHLKNDIDRATIKKINSERDKISEEIRKVAAEADNEIVKKMLYEAETNLRDMEAREIAALLPYKKVLMDAQTVAQKASAAANFAKAAIDNGLLESGYVENMIDQQCAEYRRTVSDADRAEYDAEVSKFKAAVRNGTAITIPADSSKAKMYWTYFVDKVFQNFALLGESIGGVQGLAGVAVGAALRGGNKTTINTAPSKKSSDWTIDDII